MISLLIVVILILPNFLLAQYANDDDVVIRHGKSRLHMVRPIKYNHYDYLLKNNLDIAHNITFELADDPSSASESPPERSTRSADYLEAERRTDSDGEKSTNFSERKPAEIDIVTRFLHIVESQQQLGENCSAGTDLHLGEGVVDRYAQERFRVEADVAVNRANMWTRLWKYAGATVLNSEYLLHAAVVSMVEFDDDIFAAGNCYDQHQYKNYSLFCAYAFRLPDGPILAKNLAVEYNYMSNSSEFFFIARKSAERIIQNHDQFRKAYNAYTYNDTAHYERQPDEILSVKYEDGKWSKPYYDCGGGNIWMLTYTVPFFGFTNGSYIFKGTSGIDIDLRRVDIDQCPQPEDSQVLNIFAGSDKCKKETTMCVAIPGLGFRRGSYKCECRRGFYYPDTKATHRYYNGTLIEDEYEKLIMVEKNGYAEKGMFECLPCAEGCDSCLDSRPCIVSLNWVMRTIILALSCAIILFLPAIVVFTWKYANIKVVRAASPVLLRFITLGAFFIYCTPIVMYPTPNIGTCTIRVWLREIGFSLTYGALMLKTWRISVIFHVRSAKPVRITDLDLLKRLGVIVSVFCVLLIIRTLVAPPVVITGRTADDLKAYLCSTDWWDHSFTSMEVMFLIWGIRLCIVVRKAPSEFNEARFISMAIYNEFLLTVFLKVSMLFLQSPANPDLLYIIFFCHTQLTVTLLLCLIFGSKVYIVFRDQSRQEEQSAASKAQTTYLKPKSANSHHVPSSQTSGRQEVVENVEKELQMEFQRVCVQLEALKENHRKLGNQTLVARIGAMQEAARRDYNKVLAEVQQKVDNKPTANAVISAEMVREKTDESAVGSKRVLGKSKSLCGACGGGRRVEEEEIQRVCLQECEECRSRTKTDRVRSVPVEPLRYGHAKTRSIVINLDDSNRFSDEVTV